MTALERLRKLSILNSSDPLCKICKGQGWVCENHPGKPFNYGWACGAGMPCVCNDLHEDNRDRAAGIKAMNEFKRDDCNGKTLEQLKSDLGIK